MIISFVLQAVALHFGRLSQVQPILTTELVFLVVILAVWFGFTIGRREWLGSLAVTGGLAGSTAPTRLPRNAVHPVEHASIERGTSTGDRYVVDGEAWRAVRAGHGDREAFGLRLPEGSLDRAAVHGRQHPAGPRSA
jgi:hypothetical protein